jgi:hypothetical protein
MIFALNQQILGCLFSRLGIALITAAFAALATAFYLTSKTKQPFWKLQTLAFARSARYIGGIILALWSLANLACASYIFGGFTTGPEAMAYFSNKWLMAPFIFIVLAVCVNGIVYGWGMTRRCPHREWIVGGVHLLGVMAYFTVVGALCQAFAWDAFLVSMLLSVIPARYLHGVLAS